MLDILTNSQAADANFYKVLVAGVISGILIIAIAILMVKRATKYGVMGLTPSILKGQIWLVSSSLIGLIPLGYFESWVIAVALFVIWAVLVITCTIWVLRHVFFIYLYVHTHRVV